MDKRTKRKTIKILSALSGSLTVAYLVAPAPFVAIAQGVVTAIKSLLEN